VKKEKLSRLLYFAGLLKKGGRMHTIIIVPKKSYHYSDKEIRGGSTIYTRSLEKT
jgi:hypothetical protein